MERGSGLAFCLRITKQDLRPVLSKLIEKVTEKIGMPKINLKKIVLFIYIPAPYALILLGMVAFICVVEVCLWGINQSLSSLFYESLESDLKYQIGIRTIPVVIGVAGALSVAYFSAERNKKLDAEKHKREIAHKQIDAANSWLLDVKLAYDNLQVVKNYTASSPLKLKAQHHTKGESLAIPKVKLSDDFLSLNFLREHGSLSESTLSNFNNILSIKRLATEVNDFLPYYIQELNDIFLKNASYDEGDDETAKILEAMDKNFSQKERLGAEGARCCINIINIINLLKTFLITFPDIAESNINSKYQIGYMKILRLEDNTMIIRPIPPRIQLEG